MPLCHTVGYDCPFYFVFLWNATGHRFNKPLLLGFTIQVIVKRLQVAATYERIPLRTSHRCKYILELTLKTLL